MRGRALAPVFDSPARRDRSASAGGFRLAPSRGLLVPVVVVRIDGVIPVPIGPLVNPLVLVGRVRHVLREIPKEDYAPKNDQANDE